MVILVALTGLAWALQARGQAGGERRFAPFPRMSQLHKAQQWEDPTGRSLVSHGT